MGKVGWRTTMVGFMDMPGMTTRTGVAFLEVGAEFAGGGLDAFEVRGVPFGEFGQVEELSAWLVRVRSDWGWGLCLLPYCSNTRWGCCDLEGCCCCSVDYHDD